MKKTRVARARISTLENERLDAITEQTGESQSDFIRRMINEEFLRRFEMSLATMDVAYTNEYQCPHCGERYIDKNAWRDAGETRDEVCDGHEGCGKEFRLQIIDSE